MKENYLSSKQLANALGISRQRVHQMTKEGKIRPSINAGGNVFLFSLANVQKIMAKYPSHIKIDSEEAKKHLDTL